MTTHETTRFQQMLEAQAYIADRQIAMSVYLATSLRKPLLVEQICRFMELIRRQKLEKIPGVAETLDWARALVALHQKHRDFQVVEETLGLVFKDWNDIRQMKESLAEFLEGLGIHSTLTPAFSPAAPASLEP